MSQTEQLTATAIHTWKLVIGRLDKALAKASDEDLEKRVAPGRNRVFYLLGHLTAVHDLMIPLLGLGERLHSELDATFITNPDQHAAGEYSAADLRKAWAEVNGALLAAFEALTPGQWLERHTGASPEEFAKDPLRNRLAVLMNRTNHASFHLGQIRLTQ